MTDLVDVVRGLAAAPVGADARRAARLRIADTAFATAVGARTGQGRRAAALAADRFGAGSPAAGVFRLVAACRMTEIDDVDLFSCVTPGSVVVPTVLALLDTVLVDLDTVPVGLDTVLDAVARGYEVALGLGEAMRGPDRLATGVWPTLAVGGVTAAAVTSWLLGADDAATAAAVALAAEQSTGGNPRGDAREILLAEAVVAGVGAALAVRHGFAVSGGRGGALGPMIEGEPDPATPAGTRVHRPAVKAFCSARQAMTAVSALRQILASGDVPVDAIERIDVDVPPVYATMLAKPTVTNRRDSLSSAPYQLALAALDPAGLRDVDRPTLRDQEPFRALMSRVHVHAVEDLAPRYPRQWPARVRVTVAWQTFEATAHDVPGERDLTAERLLAKARDLAATGVTTEPVDRVLAATTPADLRAVTALIDPARVDPEIKKEAFA